MLASVFGIPIKCEAWKHQDSLPVYIAGSYDFQIAYIGNKRCIMLAPTEELATVSNYRRKSLIENNIPFITDKQVFLPFVGTMLSDEKEPSKLRGKFVYSTQQLFLVAKDGVNKFIESKYKRDELFEKKINMSSSVGQLAI